MSDTRTDIAELSIAAAEFERTASEEPAWTSQRATELQETFSRDPIHQGKTVGAIRQLAVFAKHVVHPERSGKNGVATQPFKPEEAPDEAPS
jgi:hypothetical protein